MDKSVNLCANIWTNSESPESPATPPKFDTANENGWLEDYFPFGKVTFPSYVKLWGCITRSKSFFEVLCLFSDQPFRDGTRHLGNEEDNSPKKTSVFIGEASGQRF